jgi:hypothetical protein
LSPCHLVTPPPCHFVAGSAYVVLLLGGCVSTAFAESPARNPDIAYAERTLRAAGVATDGRGVLAFIREHTLSEKALQKLAATVRELGAAEFTQREKASQVLVAAGRPALPFLRPAVHDSDLEIVRRAQRCIEDIQRSSMPVVMTAAAQVLKDRRPPGAAAVLLAYLPCSDEEGMEDIWLDVLRAVGLPEDRPDPALLTALQAKQPRVRAAAAHVFGRASSAEVRRRVAPLLADADARVRYEAAAGLARFGDKSAVPVLLALLSEAPLPIACRSEYLLCLLADNQGPTLSFSDSVQVAGEGGRVEGDSKRLPPPARRQCRDAWEEWWRKQGDRVDLTRLQREETLRGLTVVCEYDGLDGGRVWAGGPDGKPLWEILRLEGPNDIQLLPGGRVLIAERNANRVTERDHQGKILWQHHCSGNPISCQRLANGNTLIATFRELYEVTIDQRKVFSHADRREYRHALALPNGHVLYITRNGLLVEMEANSKREVRTIRPANYSAGATYWANLEVLPNGRYLLALGGSSRVIEIDLSGKIHWECTVPSAVFATRLRNGHTLVSSFEERSVIEVDRAGKEVRKQSLRGRPFVARRY